MDPNAETEVKDVDRVEIAPAPEGSELVEAEPTAPGSSPAEGASESEPEAEAEGEDKPDEIVHRQTPEPATPPKDNLAEVPGETPKERALRLEVTALRGKLRAERAGEIFTPPPPATAPSKTELSPEKKAVLAKYKPEEISALGEVINVMADEMGFVRKDQLTSSTFQERSQEVLDTFLDKHPEYLPENDKDGTLWNAFKAEYANFKQPTNPKDFQKIFDRVHREVFNIKPAGALPNNAAARERITVSSHAGASSRPGTQRQPAVAGPQGLRTDMLKGFTDEEKAEITG